MSSENWKKILPVRRKDSHKGDYGHVLILAGSVGLSGAAYLTSQAALLAGSGLVSLGIPNSLNPIMEVKLTEVMTKPLAETKECSLSPKALGQIKKLLPEIDALAIGPGLSRNLQTQKLVHKILRSFTQPLVLDADGINALIGKLAIFNHLKAQAVLTPHPVEMSRLLNVHVEVVQRQRNKIAQEFAKKYRLVVVLKGHHTVVADGHAQAYVNQTGNPGMASGGCGDVLTGIIVAFLGQGIAPYQAAKLAVYVHGLAGDLAKEEKGEISLTATDLLVQLPCALKTLRK